MSPRQKHVPLRIHRNRIVVIRALLSGSGNGGDDAAGVDLAQSGVGSICDVDIALGVECHAAGLVERRVGCRTTVALRTIQAPASPGTRHQMDGPVRRDLANAAVAGDDIEVALWVHRERPCTEKSCLQRGTPITRISGLAGSCKWADGPIGSDLTDAIPSKVAHIQVTRGIEYGSPYPVECRVDGWATVAAGEWIRGGVVVCATDLADGNKLPVSSHCGDDALGRDPSYAGVAKIGNP